MTEIDPYEAPKALVVEPAPPHVGPLPASRWARATATLIDAIVFVAVTGLIAVLTHLLLVTADADSVRWRFALIDVLSWGGIALLQVGQAWLVHRTGATLGKLALRLRIVRPDGGRVGFLRYLLLRVAPPTAAVFVIARLSTVPGLPSLAVLLDVLPIFTPSRRCLHDYLAGTIVVQARGRAPLRRAGPDTIVAQREGARLG